MVKNEIRAHKKGLCVPLQQRPTSLMYSVPPKEIRIGTRYDAGRPRRSAGRFKASPVNFTCSATPDTCNCNTEQVIPAKQSAFAPRASADEFYNLKLIRAFQFRLPWIVPPRQEAQVKGGEKKSIFISDFFYYCFQNIRNKFDRSKFTRIFLFRQSCRQLF